MTPKAPGAPAAEEEEEELPPTTDMPEWTWNPVAKSYLIDGSTTTGGNPNLGIALTSNQAITTLEVTKPGSSYGFSLPAPDTVPEPSTTLLGVIAGGLCLRNRRRGN